MPGAFTSPNQPMGLPVESSPLPLVAYRSWNGISIEQGLIGHYGIGWKKPRMIGQCSDFARGNKSGVPNHPTPDPQCNCGIYARKDLGQVSAGTVIGRVLLSGTIIEGSMGHRAQQADIDCLVVRADWQTNPDAVEWFNWAQASPDWASVELYWMDYSADYGRELDRVFSRHDPYRLFTEGG